MPLVQISMWEGKDKETKKEIIERVTEDIADAINASEDAVTVIINEIPKENWATGGIPSDEINVGAGTANALSTI